MGWLDTITETGTDAYKAVTAWDWKESGEAAPRSYEQQAAGERLADGQALPKVASAQDADGKTVVVKASTNYKPLMIGGGVLVVVLLVVVLMLKGGR